MLAAKVVASVLLASSPTGHSYSAGKVDGRIPDTVSVEGRSAENAAQRAMYRFYWIVWPNGYCQKVTLPDAWRNGDPFVAPGIPKQMKQLYPGVYFEQWPLRQKRSKPKYDDA